MCVRTSAHFLWTVAAQARLSWRGSCVSRRAASNHCSSWPVPSVTLEVCVWPAASVVRDPLSVQLVAVLTVVIVAAWIVVVVAYHSRGAARAVQPSDHHAWPWCSTKKSSRSSVPYYRLLLSPRFVVRWCGRAGIAIATALRDNAGASTLRKLSLCDCGLGDGAAAAFGAALAAQGAAAAAPPPPTCAADAAAGGSAACEPDSSSDEGQGGGSGGGLATLMLIGNKGIGVAGGLALADGIRAAGPWLQQVSLCLTSVGGKVYKEGAGGGAVESLLTATEAWHLRHNNDHNQEVGGSGALLAAAADDGAGSAPAAARRGRPTYRHRAYWMHLDLPST